MKVFKYPLEVTDEQEVLMPPGAEILCVQVQYKAPCLWAMVDDTQERTETRVIRIYGSGQPTDQVLGKHTRYIGTFQLVGGEFVGHVFEVVPFSGI